MLSGVLMLITWNWKREPVFLNGSSGLLKCRSLILATSDRDYELGFRRVRNYFSIAHVFCETHSKDAYRRWKRFPPLIRYFASCNLV